MLVGQAEADSSEIGAHQAIRCDSSSEFSLSDFETLIDWLLQTIRSKLERLIKRGKPVDELYKNIQDLTNQLELVIEQAEAERAAAQLEKIKRPIREAAKQYLAAARQPIR